ncbi:MAG: DUF421 domain-containing protein [bacterium]|nr:DUF421 domain-containing protein [bacterium]
MINLVIRTLILYLTVTAALRIMGKRQLGELQPSELVVAIMISDLASVPMQDIGIPIFSGIIPAVTLIAAEVLLSFMSLKSNTVRRFVSGSPSIVVYDGHINEKELNRLRFNINDLLEELRINGYYDVKDVQTAIVETSGKLSIIPKDSSRPVTVADMEIINPGKEGLPYILIADGRANKSELQRAGKDIVWLKDELKKRGLILKQVFVCSLDVNGGLFVQRKGERDEK